MIANALTAKATSNDGKRGAILLKTFVFVARKIRISSSGRTNVPAGGSQLRSE